MGVNASAGHERAGTAWWRASRWPRWPRTWGTGTGVLGEAWCDGEEVVREDGWMVIHRWVLKPSTNPGDMLLCPVNRGFIISKNSSTRYFISKKTLILALGIVCPYLSSSSWKKNLMEVYFFHGKYDGKEEKIIYKYEMQIYILQIHVQFIYIQLTYNMYVKNLPASAGDPGLFPGLERCPGEGNGNPLQCSCLENPHGQRSLAGYNPRGHRESVT